MHVGRGKERGHEEESRFVHAGMGDGEKGSASGFDIGIGDESAVSISSTEGGWADQIHMYIDGKVR